jgi:hypothetical protein
MSVPLLRTARSWVDDYEHEMTALSISTNAQNPRQIILYV